MRKKRFIELIVSEAESPWSMAQALGRVLGQMVRMCKEGGMAHFYRSQSPTSGAGAGFQSTSPCPGFSTGD